MGHPSFGPMWPTRNPAIVTITRKDGIRIAMHREVVPLFTQLMDLTEDRFGYDIKPGQTWGYANRPIRGTRTPSNHSQGTALDINSLENPQKRPLTIAPKWRKAIDEIWVKFHIRAGAYYRGTPDSMHVEYMGTVAEARADAETVRRVYFGGPTETVVTVIRDRTDRPFPPGAEGLPGGGYRRQEFEGKTDGNVAYAQGAFNLTNLQPKLFVDGKLGPNTERAIRGFQGAQGLDQDGVLGPKTWNRLNEITQ